MQHPRELSIVPFRVDEAHAKILVGGLDRDAGVSHEAPDEGDVTGRVIDALMAHQLLMMLESGRSLEEIESGIEVSVEHGQSLSVVLE